MMPVEVFIILPEYSRFDVSLSGCEDVARRRLDIMKERSRFDMSLNGSKDIARQRHNIINFQIR